MNVYRPIVCDMIWLCQCTGIGLLLRVCVQVFPISQAQAFQDVTMMRQYINRYGHQISISLINRLHSTDQDTDKGGCVDQDGHSLCKHDKW
jgi:hypothetical protein